MAQSVIHIKDSAAAAQIVKPTLGVRLAFFPILAAGIVLLFLLELSIGTVKIPVSEIVNIIFGGATQHVAWSEIILRLRMPRAVTATIASSALAAGGLLLQTLFRNPLAGPWVLGITAGAKCGVALTLVIAGASSVSAFGRFGFLGNLSLAGGATLGAVMALLLIFAISRRVGVITLLICGLMFQYLAPSVTGILLHLTTEKQVETYGQWNDATFSATTWEQLQIMAPVVLACVVIALLMSKSLNVLLLGENYAKSLGLNLARTKLLAIVSMIGLSGVVTAFCGPVTFLDLAVPHLCRGLFKTSDHRALMPAVILTGAFIGLAADLFVHLPWERHVFHLNYVTALIGAPVILWIILRQKHMRTMDQ